MPKSAEGKTSFHISDFSDLRLPHLERRLRLGMVGGGQGAFIGEVHAMGARLSNCWEVVAGALSSDPVRARQSAKEWYIPADRAYDGYAEMAVQEAKRDDGIEAVVITLPNHLHYDAARVFLDNGIDVICDKPLTTTSEEAVDLVERTERTGLVFGVTYAFAAYPMVRQARQMIADGAIGRIRQIHVEFLSDWLTAPLPPDHKQAAWRLDPAKTGGMGASGDIGTHAFHLATFVSGLSMTKLRAEMLVCGPPRAVDDTLYVSARYEGDVAGLLLATAVAPGNSGGLRFRIFGDRAGLEWDQEQPEYLRYSVFGEPARVISRGVGSHISPAAIRFTRTPRAHPEGWIEAWANLYTEFAIAIDARRRNKSIEPGLLNYPTVKDGERGIRFLEAAAASSAADGQWFDFPA